MDENIVSLFPIWKQAVQDFLSEGLQPGQMVTHQWLNEHFRLDEPKTVEDYKRHQFAFLQNMDAFRECLLEAYSIALRSRPGQGYEIVAPEQQTAYAVEQGMRRVKRELNWMADHLVNVDHSKLTNDQRKQNADALARAAMMKQMFRKAKRTEMSQQTKKIEN
jgi:hypothetical protein